ncbi:MAG: DUF1707 domain-containing protein [Actinomycetota bacterium]|nr:DUF1707 domain-containing protein [Actinomycetota bacterium]
MRVSDAERHEIADALSTHFADGRLDQQEFDERMGRAMAAKTRGDLAGLLRDLPPLEGSPPPPSPCRTHPRSRALVLPLVAAFLLLATGPWAWSFAGWGAWASHRPQPPVVLVLIALGVVLLARRSRRRWPGSAGRG